ncbi:MAG: NADH-quinone oxidoreductase subunit NuoH [Candidatus Azobacteroides pseudotrichonymphae]|jgi:NADH-quinone oxidoreductase subunit H|nr:NADH-quinone oxidoreductase subunit NuoH [Bacteroidales bacterium OttesenSCG-928-I14]GMO32020.1 MAG: NADH-quinone oxidoreductase subunit NuoH [Candidatus Azobacteroides pseudotrichonymphae]
MFHLDFVTNWINKFLQKYLIDGWVLLVEFVLIAFVILIAYAVLALLLIYLERKVCAFFQCRLGPTRVGPWGIFQSVADMIKILLKELIRINKVDVCLFHLATYIVIIASICTFGAIPFDKGLHVVDFNIGVFYLLSVSSIGVVGILLAGWASNNKYTIIGAIRSGAQLISYELSCGLSLMTVVMLSGSLQLSSIVEQQSCGWNIVRGGIPAIIAFIIYLIAGHAETNRGPFDLPEAESELTAGYHTEYSGIQFGFFYLAEYLNMFIIAAIATTLFLGGWMPLHIPGWNLFNEVMNFIPSILWFFVKTFICIFLALWVRWTMPRLRIDQLLNLEWKILMPISLINIILMAFWIIYL